MQLVLAKGVFVHISKKVGHLQKKLSGIFMCLTLLTQLSIADEAITLESEFNSGINLESEANNGITLESEAPESDLEFPLIDPEKEIEVTNTPLQRFNFNIQSGLDIYFTPQILKFLSHNADTIFETQSGISPTAYYIHEYDRNSGEKSLDQMISNEKTLSSIKNIRYYFRKFFNGIRIRDTHNFDLDIDGIDFSVNWKNFGVEISQDVEKKSVIYATIKLEADRFAINIDSLKVSDQKHPFIGKIGGDKVYLNLDQTNSPNLKIEIPIEIETFNGNIEQLFGENQLDNGDIRIKVLEPQTNIADIVLNAGWIAPLTMPKVSVSINGQNAYLRTDRVESAIKKQIPELVKGLQESLQKYVSENVPSIVEDQLVSRFQAGYRSQTNFDIFYESDKYHERVIRTGEFNHPQYPAAYLLGYRFKNFSMTEGHLKLSFDTFMEDGKLESNDRFNPVGYKPIYPKELFKAEGLDHNAAIVANLDLVNRYIQLSCDRGLFKDIQLESGSRVKVSNCPQVYVHENEKELRLKVEVEDTVGGFWKSKLVRNPIKVKFEAGIRIQFNEDGTYELILSRMYENTLEIEDKYIRYKIFKKAIIDAAKKILTGLNKEYKNYSMEKIVLPPIYEGIPLKYLGYKLSKEGYMAVFVKVIL